MAALVKIDRSQSKTVAALLVLLAFALAVLGYRMRPQVTRRQGLLATAAGASSVTAQRAEVPGSRRSAAAVGPGFRNPFAAPSAAGAISSERVTGNVGVKPVPVALMQNSRHSRPWGSDGFAKVIADGDVVVEPASRQRKESEQARVQSREVQDAPYAQCTLLATVASDQGWSAVIQFGNSVVKTVETGDVLDDGFKVVRLSRDEAVLSNGKQTIVARRPG